MQQINSVFAAQHQTQFDKQDANDVVLLHCTSVVAALSSHKLSQHPEKLSKLVVFQHFYQVKCDQFRKYSSSVLYFALFVNLNAHTLSCQVANLVSCKHFSIFCVVYSVHKYI